MKYGDQVFEITTVSTNEIVIRYKILYYEIITLIKNMEGTVAQIKDAPPSNTTAVMLKVRASHFKTDFDLKFTEFAKHVSIDYVIIKLLKLRKIVHIKLKAVNLR